LLVQQYRN
jgi:hypothetical protein